MHGTAKDSAICKEAEKEIAECTAQWKQLKYVAADGGGNVHGNGRTLSANVQGE
jgi:hypothetical protein